MADFKITKLIEKKRNGETLSRDDIGYFVHLAAKSGMGHHPAASIDGSMDRSQIGAMLMAIFFNGLDHDETTELTLSMKNSGYVFSWPEEFRDLVVDKHSTGGVGDKVSLVLAPALAAVGLKVPMISGRSLGHTGGTLNKLESIPGYRVLLTEKEIRNIIETVGCCIVGQTEDCVPADKVLYQCRDITATVNCPPLIIASIASKKLSEGTKALVYDVKFGKGSIFSSKEEAEATARKLVEFSKGTTASALLTSMDSPLGRTIGNALEVLEAVECLRGEGPTDVIQLTCSLGSELLHSVKNTTKSDGESMILEALKDGRALQKFHEMLLQQGVSIETAKELCYGNAASIFPKTVHETPIYYDGEEGYIQDIDPLTLAKICKEELTISNQHPGVGLTLLKVVGDKIQAGEPWMKIHHQSSEIADERLQQLKNALDVKNEDMKKKVLIDKRIFMSDDFILKRKILMERPFV